MGSSVWEWGRSMVSDICTLVREAGGPHLRLADCWWETPTREAAIFHRRPVVSSPVRWRLGVCPLVQLPRSIARVPRPSSLRIRVVVNRTSHVVSANILGYPIVPNCCVPTVSDLLFSTTVNFCYPIVLNCRVSVNVVIPWPDGCETAVIQKEDGTDKIKT